MFCSHEIPNGYRDIQLSVLYSDENSLSIIGEIQVHDAQLYHLKQKVSFQSNSDLPPSIVSLSSLCGVVATHASLLLLYV